MKKLLLALLLVFLLTGCQSMFPNEYRFVQEHKAPFAYRETETEPPETESNGKQETIPEVSRASDIREAIQNMVDSGEDNGVFLLHNYDGNVAQDMETMYNDLLDNSPKYVYAMVEPFSWSVSEIEAGTVVSITMERRLTPQEVQAIPTLRFELVKNEIYTALLQQSSTCTVQISGYEDTDFYSLLDDVILEHPNQIVEAPDVTFTVFPNRGSVRVLELRFFYDTDRDVLEKRKEDVKQIMDIINNQLSFEQSPSEIVETLYRHLVFAGYKTDANATIYSQMVQKTGGNSRTMASVAAYLCTSVAKECEIVVGERNGEPWYWNRIMTNAGWRYFDLHGCALSGDSPA